MAKISHFFIFAVIKVNAVGLAANGRVDPPTGAARRARVVLPGIACPATPPTLSLPNPAAERGWNVITAPLVCQLDVSEDLFQFHTWLPIPGMAEGCVPSWQCDITPSTSNSLHQVTS